MRQHSIGRKFIIDATMIRGGGGFTHLVNVLPDLAAQAPHDQFRVLCGERSVAERLPRADNLEIVYLGEMGLKARLRFTYSGAARYAAEWGADVYFAASEMAPLSMPCATIATFQNANITDLGRAQKLHWKQRLRFRILNLIARLSAVFSDRVMFVSESSAAEMGHALGIPSARRAAVPHGIDATRWKRPEAGFTAPHDCPYILSVSSIYPYKNYVRLIEAYAQLAERRADLPDLVIVGDNQDQGYFEAMEEARRATGALAKRIHIRGEVPYEEVHRYYQGASLFVMPSHLETFGFPLLEAMASSTPIVASDMPVFHEVTADAAFYADPFDVPAIASAMEEALFRPGAAEALVKRGEERLKVFTWQRSASLLLSLFREAAAISASPRVERVRSTSAPVHAGIPDFVRRSPALQMRMR